MQTKQIRAHQLRRGNEVLFGGAHAAGGIAYWVHDVRVDGTVVCVLYRFVHSDVLLTDLVSPPQTGMLFADCFYANDPVTILEE